VFAIRISAGTAPQGLDAGTQSQKPPMTGWKVVAKKGATTGVCRAEGGIKVRPSGGRGVKKLPKVSRNGL